MLQEKKKKKKLNAV